MSRSRFLPLLFVLGLFASCATTPKPIAASPAETALTSLVVARLEVAREVAWIKFVNSQPVRDPKREAELLNRMVNEGQAAGLDGAAVQAFFKAQIAASCRVQEECIRYWSRGGTLPAMAPRDLKRDIRPKLDRIGASMLAELAQLKGNATSANFEAYTYQTIRAKGFSWRVARLAVAPLN